MRENISMTESMDLAFILGRMDVSMRATGTTESSMVTASTDRRMAVSDVAAGRKASAATGLTRRTTRAIRLTKSDLILIKTDYMTEESSI